MILLRRIRTLAVLIALAFGSLGCTPAEPREDPSESATETTDSSEAPAASEVPAPPEEIVVGRWRGHIVERHPEFTRYAFTAEGEPEQIVELLPRRAEHDARGSADTTVQPGPGAAVDPELLEAIAQWLATRPTPDRPDFGRQQAPKRSSEPEQAARWARPLGLALLLSWALAGIFAWRSSPRTTTDSSPRWGRLLLIALGVALLAFGLRAGLAAPSPLHDDALRDYGAALAHLAGAPPAGASASFGGFDHGTGFVRLLALALGLGLGLPGFQLLVTALWGLAIAVTFAAGWRLGGRERGLWLASLAAAFSLALLLAELATTGEMLWNPSIVALPAALTAATLLRGAQTGRAGPLLLAGLCAGLAAEAHLAGVALWPSVVLISAATARAAEAAESSTGGSFIHRLVWLPALAGALAVPLLVSPGTAAHAGQRIITELGIGGALMATLATLAAAALLHRWLQRGVDPSARASALALVAPPLLLVLVMALFGDLAETRRIRDVAPQFPALALALAWVSSEALARLPSARARLSATFVIAALVLSAARLRPACRGRAESVEPPRPRPARLASARARRNSPKPSPARARRPV